MSGWYLERQGAEATRIELVPVAGKITLEWPHPGVERDALDGTRNVWQSAPGLLRISIPPLFVDSNDDLDRLRLLVTSAARLTLMTDTGASHTVRALNGLRAELEDTVDRDIRPIYSATIALVGV